MPQNETKNKNHKRSYVYNATKTQQLPRGPMPYNGTQNKYPQRPYAHNETETKIQYHPMPRIKKNKRSYAQ